MSFRRAIQISLLFFISACASTTQSTNTAVIADTQAEQESQTSSVSDSTEKAPEQTYVVWIYFEDKGPPSWINSFADTQVVSKRSLRRRAKVRQPGNELDFTDYPVYKNYLDAVTAEVEDVRHTSKWFNAVSVVATQSQLNYIGTFSFVKNIGLVERYKTSGTNELLNNRSNNFPETTTSFNYGYSEKQVSQLNVPAAHVRGNYGQGVLVGMFDDGFLGLEHPVFNRLQVRATYDFVLDREEPWPLPGEPTFGNHGMMTLSTIAGYAPGYLIGPAFGAEYVLARTEDTFSETPLEEDNFMKAIEWADSIGIDIASISLGYSDYDEPFRDHTWDDMDGNTALITQAADMAVEKGILVVASAGNNTRVKRDADGNPILDANGNYQPTSEHNTLGAPADGDNVLSVGAVDADGNWVSFSSVGPTGGPNPRIKPDVAAMGYEAVVATVGQNLQNPWAFRHANGTSFAGPLTAGAAVLALHDIFWAPPLTIKRALKETASNAKNPNNFIGWGIPNIEKAIEYLRNNP